MSFSPRFFPSLTPAKLIILCLSILVLGLFIRQASQPLTTQAANQCSAEGEEQPSGIFRPRPCENCSTNIPNPVNSCVEPATLINSVSYQCSNLNENNGSWTGSTEWAASFSIDMQNASMPFAGYRDVIKNEKGQSLNLNNYLNDYIDGSAMYDGTIPEFTKSGDEQEFVRTLGVYRRLAPKELQDAKRIEVIKSGFDYEVKSGSLTKHTIGLTDEQGGSAAQRQNSWWPEYWQNPSSPPPPKPWPEGKLPPDPKDSRYQGNQALFETEWATWMGTDWGKLWPYIPLSLLA